MVCSSYTVAAIESLVAVTLTGKVSFSAYEPKHTNAFNITQGETFTISFLADPKATVRMGISDPTITVHDNVAPYEVCATDFSMKFEKGVSAQLGAPPVSLLGEVGSFYFALSQARPVRDAAWLSQDVVVPGAVGTAVEQTVGIPLTFKGQPAKGNFRPSKFMGIFSVRPARSSTRARPRCAPPPVARRGRTSPSGHARAALTAATPRAPRSSSTTATRFRAWTFSRRRARTPPTGSSAGSSRSRATLTPTLRSRSTSRA